MPLLYIFYIIFQFIFNTTGMFELKIIGSVLKSHFIPDFVGGRIAVLKCINTS